MQWLLFYLLLPLIGASVFEFEVPSVLRPNVDKSKLKERRSVDFSGLTYFEAVGGREQHLPYTDFEIRPDGAHAYYPRFFGAQKGVEDGAKINIVHMKALQHQFPNVTGDWEAFNEGDNTNDISHLKGPTDEIEYISAFRRIVINETLIGNLTNVTLAPNGKIDYMDEYQIYQKCTSAELKKDHLVIEKFEDFAFVKFGYVHYVRRNFVCGPRLFGPHSFFAVTQDQFQGQTIPSLGGIYLRTSKNQLRKIMVWRSFIGFADRKWTTEDYPTHIDRLRGLGFPLQTLDDIIWANDINGTLTVDPERELALRRFTRPLLRKWRIEVAGMGATDVDSLEAAEENSLNWWYLEMKDWEKNPLGPPPSFLVHYEKFKA